MHKVWKRITGYFLSGIVFVSAVGLSISFAITNNLKTKNEHNGQTKFHFPEAKNPPYPVKDAPDNYFYCWVNLGKFLNKKDYFEHLFNINHFYDQSIPILDQKYLGSNLNDLMKLAISRSPYFQKKLNKIQKLTVDYKDSGNDSLEVNCLFTFGEYQFKKQVWYYDQLTISSQVIDT